MIDLKLWNHPCKPGLYPKKFLYFESQSYKTEGDGGGWGSRERKKDIFCLIDNLLRKQESASDTVSASLLPGEFIASTGLGHSPDPRIVSLVGDRYQTSRASAALFLGALAANWIRSRWDLLVLQVVT